MEKNRKFLYGDGFFETLIVKNKAIQFWDDHCTRIQNACKALRLNFKQSLLNSIHEQLFQQISTSESYRIRIVFWRNSDGLYTPNDNEIDFSIDILPFNTEFIKFIDTISFAESIQIQNNIFSAFKINSLPYVMAGIEKKHRNIENLIILNTGNYICETISENIFWIKENTVFTPHLDSGCIDGIMRKNIIKFLKNESIRIEEGLYYKGDLKDVESIFLTNVRGITHIRTFFNKPLKTFNTHKMEQYLSENCI